MLSYETILAGAMMISLTFYALMGGADYGGGVWDLLAWGPRKKAQRTLIADAIGPIWEANHVWLILVIVILFTAFPPAFAAISTALHIPLALLLIGIVLRGSAFTFRSYDKKTDDVQQRWGRVFAVASLITPMLLGITVGALSSGAIQFQNGMLLSGFVQSWFAPFPLSVGIFALSLFAFLAAVYLTVEAPDPALQEDFRRRALGAAVVVAVMALVVYLLSATGAPVIRRDLSASWWTWPLQIATAMAATGAVVTLWRRQFRLARLFAAAQVTLILWGWGNAQYPYLVIADFTIQNSAAPVVTLRLVTIALLAGIVLLFPSFYYLYYVFKAEPQAPDSHP
jgi:cytochrome bd ubiquinol oxidase subunit II